MESTQMENDGREFAARALQEALMTVAPDSPPPMVITFSPDGEVRSLKRDEFNLGFLGKQEVDRASTIDWDDDTQSWGINLKGEYAWYNVEPVNADRPWAVRGDSLNYEDATGFDSYEAARDVEVRWIEHCQHANVQPLSVEGLAFLRILRSRKKVA